MFNHFFGNNDFNVHFLFPLPIRIAQSMFRFKWQRGKKLAMQITCGFLIQSASESWKEGKTAKSFRFENKIQSKSNNNEIIDAMCQWKKNKANNEQSTLIIYIQGEGNKERQTETKKRKPWKVIAMRLRRF